MARFLPADAREAPVAAEGDSLTHNNIEKQRCISLRSHLIRALGFYNVRAISNQRRHPAGVWPVAKSLSHSVWFCLLLMSRGTSSKTFIGTVGELSALNLPESPVSDAAIDGLAGAVYT